MNAAEGLVPLQKTFGTRKPLIGMIHLLPLPGAPRYGGDGISRALDAALRDARALQAGGIDGLLMENYGDSPFKPTPSDPETVASMTAIGREISRQVDLPMGVNVLRNGALAALAIAHAVCARFIRVNVLTESLMTDQGVINACAHDLMRYRKQIGAAAVQIYADVRSKHAAPIVSRPVEESARDTAYRGMADALIVTGPHTGAEPDRDQLRRIKQSVPDKAVLIGSGLASRNAVRLLGEADGAIVGTSLKQNGKIERPIDETRVKELVRSIARLR
ncbi:BtpA/SgcQ family protein [[Eubacterium] cellulosolvens]